ncbi:MAG: YPDG domain-containing protein, partial [Ezakiella sp.]|nr:YPDG domain-containing protein [Ezakiella sp.]
MTNHKKIISWILALIMVLSPFTDLIAASNADQGRAVIDVIDAEVTEEGNEVFYTFNLNNGMDNTFEKSMSVNDIDDENGFEISDPIVPGPVGAGKPGDYPFKIKADNIFGVAGKDFDWNALPDGLAIQMFYIDSTTYQRVTIGVPIVINSANANTTINRTFKVDGNPLSFGFTTNLDKEAYLDDAYLIDRRNPRGTEGTLEVGFILQQLPSLNLNVKWLDMTNQKLSSDKIPANSIQNAVKFDVINDANVTFDLPNEDTTYTDLRLQKQIKRGDLDPNNQNAKVTVNGKSEGIITLDGKTYELATTYDPSYNVGGTITLKYMLDIVPQPGDEKPEVPDNFVLVEFLPGTNGTLEGTTKYWVNPDANKTLADVTKPTVVANEGYKHTGWDKEDTTAITEALTVTAEYDENDAKKYTPEYEDGEGNPGEDVTVPAPDFKDKDGNPTEKPDGTKFTPGENAPDGVTVDENTGEITVTIPEDATPGDKITVPVVVTYPDDSTETVEVEITVTEPEDKTKDPTIDQPTEGDDKITGKGEPGSKIVVELQDGTQVDGEVDKDGNWSVDVPANNPLKAGDTIKATQIDTNGKSKEATTTVKAKYKPEPEKPYDPGYRYEPSPDYLNKPSRREEPKRNELDVDLYKSYIDGNEEGKFLPNKGLTRAEAAQILANALRADGYRASVMPSIYSDVAGSEWYGDAISIVTQAGVFKGTDKGTFEPLREITKAEWISVIARFEELGTALGNSMNLPAMHWATGEVEAAYKEGWLKVYTDGIARFDANQIITRAEVVAIANKAFNRPIDVKYIDKNIDKLKTFQDVNSSDWYYYDV